MILFACCIVIDMFTIGTIDDYQRLDKAFVKNLNLVKLIVFCMPICYKLLLRINYFVLRCQAVHKPYTETNILQGTAL